MTIKYIFCINTGRSGSDYLTALLSKAKHTVSLHEGYPNMNGYPMQRFNNGDERALRELMPIKIKEIRKKNKNGRKIYCETNHAFIKGWGYLIPEYIPQDRIGVIILRRNTEKVVYDFISDHKIPGTTTHTRNYMLSPDDTRNLSKPSRTSPDEICRWYIHETYFRGQQYRKMFPGITFFECDLEQLNDYGFVTRMFSTFGLVPTPELRNVVGVRVNTRHNYPEVPLDELLIAPKYPDADKLSPREQDRLIGAMIEYLREKKADEIANIQPIYTGSIMYGIRQLTGYAQTELEEVFHYSLKFTETEDILWLELLRALSPGDPAFVFYERFGPPGIHYRIDTNITHSLGTAFGKLGIRGVFQALLLMMKGKWKQDPTHRVKNPWKIRHR
uniref:Uncharacterized protein n=1 Tax=Candidatus Kentrum sp. FW TaxID=2126338 RepID=A0A450U4G8_9GAMM|nr:MAG: hypothetical protein BECKFW1821C_GA0114237_11882 [Candidatus Kentron sp. FW]